MPREYTARALLMRYYFGVYHWRRRLGRLLIAVGIGIGAGLLAQRTTLRWRRRVAATAGLVAAIIGTRTSRTLLSPPPWAIRQEKYTALARRLPFEDATTVLDVGCGTGRSLVGIAPFVPGDCTVVGLDVFDARVILGNGPTLAARNGRAAGLDVVPIVGDAARLPVATDTQDVVTACRVLHDLPASTQPAALEELHRVCAPNGTVGILELPITPADTSVEPTTYWRRQLTDAGFTVDRLERIGSDRRAEPYLVVVATPAKTT